MYFCDCHDYMCRWTCISQLQFGTKYSLYVSEIGWLFRYITRVNMSNVLLKSYKRVPKFDFASWMHLLVLASHSPESENRWTHKHENVQILAWLWKHRAIRKAIFTLVWLPFVFSRLRHQTSWAEAKSLACKKLLRMIIGGIGHFSTHEDNTKETISCPIV